MVEGEKTLIRGCPGNETVPDFGEKLAVFNHLSAGRLEGVLNEADVVIARSGYSTVMDLVAMERSAILIPTPGQTEQEYLAKTLKEQGFFYSESQHRFDLKRSLAAVSNFKPAGFPKQDELLMERLRGFLASETC